MATGDCFTGPTDLREFSARLGMQTARQRTAELVRAPTYPRKLKSSNSYHLLSPPVQPIVVDRFIEIDAIFIPIQKESQLLRIHNKFEQTFVLSDFAFYITTTSSTYILLD